VCGRDAAGAYAYGVPVVARISIAPVKGLGLVHPDEVMLERTGVRENRRFHLVDADGRRYNQLRNGRLVQIRPEYDAERERLSLHFPDGSVAEGQVEAGEEVTVDFHGRALTGNLVRGPWSEAVSAWAGLTLRLVQSAPGEAVDRGRGQVSLVSCASLAELGRNAGTDPVDGRRFRMLFELDGCAPHEEDGWVGRQVRIGAALARMRGDVGRCAITTQNPDTGEPDLDTLRTISAYRPRTGEGREPKHIPFGVYGEVLEPGRVSLGDAVELAELSLLDSRPQEH
jgi:uncharacterized protein YcbX